MHFKLKWKFGKKKIGDIKISNKDVIKLYKLSPVKYLIVPAYRTFSDGRVEILEFSVIPKEQYPR